MAIRPAGYKKISIQKNTVLDHLKITDSEGVPARVALDLPVRSRSIVKELRSRGYPVVDRRSS
jgi:hypothetical protein